MFFYLNEDCYLVKGAKRGAFYNLKNGSIYSIDPTTVKLIEECEKDKEISEVSSLITEVSKDQIDSYLKQLGKEGMGNFYTYPKKIKKISLSHSYERLDFIWLELREDCNHKCLHCYSESNQKEKEINRLSKEEWIRVIKEAYDVGCRSLQFIGGEPFLFGKGLFYIAENAKDLGYIDIQIFSNLTILTDEWIDLIAKYGIKISTSIYSKRPEIHDLITQTKGSYKRLMENAKRLEEKGVKIRYCVTVMKQNEDVVDETMEFLKEMGMENPSYDIVRPSGRATDKTLIPEKLVSKRLRREAIFPVVDKATFLRRYNGNACFQGKIAVTSTGDVIPCIMYREGCGNVRDMKLRDIIWGEELQKLWKLSLDKIEVCKDCEYRYACHDCRPSCYGATGNLFSKSPTCLYNPYEGRFEETQKEYCIAK